jgi:hypothetical protein
VYFEAVPLSLVTAVVSDQGVLGQQQVAAMLSNRVQAYTRAFGLQPPVVATGSDG